ncbi:MAG: GNAT family N-acetyltransferase, partial [Gemmatimonadetes bacterium]|nr:GNAT family N-acetyltransferase [Gemmatimonadota bacterium]
EELDRFYFVFSRNMRDLGVPVWGMDFFASILARFPDHAKFVFVEKDGDPVGAALLIAHKNVALVPSASSLRAWFRSCPNHLLYWEAFQEAHRMGTDTFDFGRSSPDSGTHRFKKQWGCEEVPCYWHYDLLKIDVPPQRNTASPKLRLAVETWKRLPLAITNRLGPILVRRIP